MSWTTSKMDSDDKKRKIDWFELKKIVLGEVWGNQFIYIYIYISSLITNSVLDCYNVFLLVSRSPSLIDSFFFYTIFPFHLYPPHVGQIFGVDTCLISTFLKSLYSSCKVENHCSGIISTLMRLEGYLQSIQCGSSSFLLRYFRTPPCPMFL